MHSRRHPRFRTSVAFACAATLLFSGYSSHGQAIAQSHGQATAERPVEVPQRRINSFIYDGADRDVVRDTLASIKNVKEDNEASWILRWTAVAETEAGKADKLLAAGDRAKASETYFSASNYFIIAGFPEYGSAAQKAALARHVEMYEKGGKLMDPPLQVNPVTARGNSFKTYFHRPKGIERPPLILWTGGTDKFKGHSYQTVKRLLALGYAVATFDLPGTGESTFWPLTPDGEFVHKAVLDFYAGRDDIDTANIFEVGVSFGGYFAIKMAAAADPRLRAVASLCPLVHMPFTLSEVGLKKLMASPERGTVAAFAERIRIDTDNTAALTKAARAFDLVPQGIVTGTPIIATPLLVVNGGRDVLSPISDLKLAAQSAKVSELWVLGMADHCFPEYFEQALPDIIKWFKQYASKP